jgi:hypothetical protein
VRVLRDRFLRAFRPINKIRGLPFKASDIEAAIEESLSRSETA